MHSKALSCLIKLNHLFSAYIFLFLCFKAVLSLLVVVTLKEVSSRSTNASPSPQQFSIESNTIQRIFTEKGRPTIIDSSRALKRVFLSNRTVTCNDGSQAGFYLRKSLKSKRWVIFLEGGWHCYDLNSCRTRWVRLRHLMTSAQWTETRDGKQKSNICITF